jgi:hypothetical protein
MHQQSAYIAFEQWKLCILYEISVLAAASMKMTVFWVVASCRLVEAYRRFKGTCHLLFQDDDALMMEAASTSETSVNLYQTTRRNNPEDSHFLHSVFGLLC